MNCQYTKSNSKMLKVAVECLSHDSEFFIFHKSQVPFYVQVYLPFNRTLISQYNLLMWWNRSWNRSWFRHFGCSCGRRKYKCTQAQEQSAECRGSKASEGRPPLACSLRVSPLIYMVSCSMYTVTEINDENRRVRLYETDEQHQGLGMSKKRISLCN